ncbi:MAG: heme biosynthesis HemY N-terminal domain-containing protein [Pseudomonadota bacterium]
MIRFFAFLIVLGLAVLAGQWLLAHPGEVSVSWFGYDIILHTAVVVALLATLTVVVALLAVTVWQLLNWPTRRRARKQYLTLSSGLKQLTLGVTALAMGDEDAAHDALKKATLALPNDPLPQLLTAQLLQRQGKHEDARAQFRALMQHEVTAPLATRRLIEQHVASREWLQATKLAEEARAHARKDRWLILTLIGLYAREKNTIDMLALTEGWQWQSPLSKEERHRYAALAHYLAADAQKNPHLRAQHLRHAVGYAPEFLPAIIAYATALQAEGELRRARKHLRAAWEKAPSIPLIAPILHTLAEESPRAQLRLLKPFLKGPQSVAHHLLAAQQAFDVDELPRAKIALEQSLAIEETKAACTLMAAIEKDLRGVDAANGWLARAVDAPAAESWICLSCGASHSAWQTHCSSCQSFDTLRYERPEQRITSVELPATL